MVLKLENKEKIVKEINEIALCAISAGIADYRGITADEMTVIRNKARENGVYLRVIRNTLASRAVENTKFSCIQNYIKGSVFWIFSKDDPSMVARLMKDTIRDYEKVKILALALDGKLIPLTQIDAVAALPNRDGALASLMLMMLTPIIQLMNNMKFTLVQLVYVLRSKQ